MGVSARAPFIAKGYAWVDKYLKFLTLQRGKGLFYFGVGILVFFMAPDTAASAIGHWGINNVAALVLLAVGAAHTFQVVKTDSGPSGSATQSIPVADDGLGFSQQMPASISAGTEMKQNTAWKKMVEDDAAL